MAFIFVNDLKNGIEIEFKLLGHDEDGNEVYFEYDKSHAVFSYNIISNNKNISNIKQLYYYYSDEENRRFLCADFSDSNGKFYLSSDYKKMVLFNEDIDVFLMSNLETEYLDNDIDLYLESDKINFDSIEDVFLCNGVNKLKTNIIEAQIMQKYDEDYSDGLILSEEEISAFISSKDENNIFCFYRGGERYLNTESLVLKRVAYRNATFYGINEFVIVKNYISKNKIKDCYIAFKKSFNITTSLKTDINNNDYYNIIVSFSGRNYYLVNEKDSLYLIDINESKLSEDVLDNFYNIVGKKYDLSFFYPKKLAIRIISWLQQIFDNNDYFTNIKFHINDGKVEKEIEDYYSTIKKVDELRLELENLKNEGVNLNNELLDKNNELDKYRKLQKDYSNSRIEIQDLKNRISELSKENDQLEHELEEQKTDSSVINAKLTNFLEWFYGHDYITSYKWKDYNNLYGNMDYYHNYYKEYKKDNETFFKSIFNQFIGKKKQLRICIVGGGNGWEVSCINDLARTYNFEISVFVIDKYIWPINKFNDNSNLKSCIVKMGDFSKILDAYSNKFDLIYFSRIINYVDSSLINWNEFAKMLNSNQESIIAVAQIILNKEVLTRNFEKMFEETYPLRRINIPFTNKTELFILKNNAYNDIYE